MRRIESFPKQRRFITDTFNEKPNIPIEYKKHIKQTSNSIFNNNFSTLQQLPISMSNPRIHYNPINPDTIYIFGSSLNNKCYTLYLTLIKY